MLRLLTLALIAVAFTNGIAQAQNVVLYKGIDGGGGRLPFDEGAVDEMGRGWNDEVSSIWIRDGFTFEGYEAINFQGASFRVDAPIGGRLVVNPSGFTAYESNGGWMVNIHKNGWNDVLSSYKVRRLR